MDSKLLSSAELFCKNTRHLKKEMPFQDPNMRRLSAFFYTLKGRDADASAIKNARRIIRDNAGIFSSFRGNTVLCISTLLALTENPEELFANTMNVYRMLKQLKFRGSDHLALAAYQIASGTTPDAFQQTAERARSFYEGFKRNHWLLTGQDDYIYAAMLGLTDLDVSSATNRMEQFYGTLKPEFWSGNSVQSLTQILVLGEESSGTIARLLSLRNRFRDQRMKIDKEYTLPSLGILAMIPVDDRQIVADVKEVTEYLRSQKGFGPLSVPQQEILLLASSLVSNRYIDDAKEGIMTTALSTSLTNILLAQQAACIAGVSAATAATASSNSSN